MAENIKIAIWSSHMIPSNAQKLEIKDLGYTTLKMSRTKSITTDKKAIHRFEYRIEKLIGDMFDKGFDVGLFGDFPATVLKRCVVDSDLTGCDVKLFSSSKVDQKHKCFVFGGWWI